jgi:hypothetical protein
MTVGVIGSLLVGLAAVGLGVEDLRKINNISHTISGLNTSIASDNTFIAGFNDSFAKYKAAAVVPAAIMIRPTTGTTVSGVVILDAGPISSNVSSVTFVASGGTSRKVQIATGKLSTIGFGAAWTSTSLPNGTYEIAAVAYQTGGRSSTSPAVMVTVKNP